MAKHIQLRDNRTRAFTIVELLIVIVVIAILASVVIVAYNGVLNRAKTSAVSAHLAQMVKQAELYNAEFGTRAASPTQLKGSKLGDEYILVGDRYCVSSKTSSGEQYYRMSDSSTVTSGACGNINPGYATAPESCFAFNAGTNALRGYYANQGNNTANPACPTKFTVPSTIGGVAVLNAESHTTGYAGAQFMALPSSMTSIAAGAFDGAGLQYIYIPSSVTSIGNAAFMNTKLGSIYLPRSVSSYGCGLFSGVTTLKSAYVSADSTDIDSSITLCSMFGGSNLEHLTIGKRIGVIGSGSCMGCTGLSSINIIDGSTPLTITESSLTNLPITEFAFPARTASVTSGGMAGATQLKKISFAEGSIPLNVSNSALGGSALEEINFPARITNISGGVFQGLSTLKKVTFTDGGTTLTIIDGSFVGTALTALALPSQTTLVSGGAFSGLSSLTSLTIAGGTKPLELGGGAFSSTGITSVTIPSRTTVVRSGAFSSAGSLSSVTIQLGVGSLETSSFGGTAVTSVSVPNSTTLASGAFPVGATITRF